MKCNCPPILLVDDNLFNILALKQTLLKYSLESESAWEGD